MVDWDAIEIELLPEERTLLLKYGYPFPDAKTQLEDYASSDGVEVLTISRFYLNQMIGDLSHSINKRTKGRIQRSLIELCDRLEVAERYGDVNSTSGRPTGSAVLNSSCAGQRPWCWCPLTN